MGHHAVLDCLKEVAAGCAGESVVITFHPHPRQVLNGDASFKVLNTIEEKKELIEQAGVDHIVLLPFTKEFAALSFNEFVRSILVEKMQARALVMGYDHHFGNKREGNFEKLEPIAQNYHLEIYRVSPEEVAKITVSSTGIRQALLSGRIREACEMLGYCYSLKGTVIKGCQNGRKINFPTANIFPDDPGKLIPARGVYAVNVIHKGSEYKGMLNIGIRPTLNGDKESIEVHVFDFDEDTYGDKMKIVFREYIREERKFEGIEALIKQLEKDKSAVMKVLTDIN